MAFIYQEKVYGNAFQEFFSKSGQLIEGVSLRIVFEKHLNYINTRLYENKKKNLAKTILSITLEHFQTGWIVKKIFKSPTKSNKKRKQNNRQLYV